MIKKILLRFKPGVPVPVHLLVAALIWSIVGLFLLFNGLLWITMAKREWFALIGLGLGTLKSFYVLDRVARKNITRSLDFADGTCLGSVYSYKTWGLVICMILLGRFLRTSLLPGEYVGILYSAIGWGLFLSSRLLWLARIRYQG
jgi:hypothetical protein